jgi:hypothetical protein
MTREEFATMSLPGKWNHIHATMDYIIKMDGQYSQLASMHSLRRRYNPHHSKEDVSYEAEKVKEQQRNLRVDQYQRWAHIKDLYAEHRDELSNTLDSNEYAECKNILERIFTMEVDDALKEITEQ